MDDSLPCDAWDSRCSQLAKQLEEARNHPAIAEYKRMRDALIYIAAHDGVLQPRVQDPSKVAKRVLEGLAPTSGATHGED